MTRVRTVAMAAGAIGMAAATAAQATSYFALAIDGGALVMTDLQAPRLTNGTAQLFEVQIFRTPTRAGGKRPADYRVVQSTFDCAKDKQRREYTADYDAKGDFVSSIIRPTAWARVKPGKDAALKALGCSGAKPQAGFPLGDVRVGKVLADYRAGRFDRFMH